MAKKTKTVRKKKWDAELLDRAMKQHQYWEIAIEQLDSVASAVRGGPAAFYSRSNPTVNDALQVVRAHLYDLQRQASRNVLGVGLLGGAEEMQKAKLFALKEFFADNDGLSRHLSVDGRYADSYGLTQKQLKVHVNKLRSALLKEEAEKRAKQDQFEQLELDNDGPLDTAAKKLRRASDLRDLSRRLETEALLQLTTSENEDDRKKGKRLAEERADKKAVEDAVTNGEIFEVTYEYE